MTFKGTTQEKINGWISFANAMNIIQPTVIDTDPKTKKPIMGYTNRQGFCVAPLSQYLQSRQAMSSYRSREYRYGQNYTDQYAFDQLTFQRDPNTPDIFGVLVAAVKEQIDFTNQLLREEIISRQDSYFSTRKPVTHTRDTFHSSSIGVTRENSARLLDSKDRTSPSFV